MKLNLEDIDFYTEQGKLRIQIYDQYCYLKPNEIKKLIEFLSPALNEIEEYIRVEQQKRIIKIRDELADLETKRIDLLRELNTLQHSDYLK